MLFEIESSKSMKKQDSCEGNQTTNETKRNSVEHHESWTMLGPFGYYTAIWGVYNGYIQVILGDTRFYEGYINVI